MAAALPAFNRRPLGAGRKLHSVERKKKGAAQKQKRLVEFNKLWGTGGGDVTQFCQI